MDYNIPDTFLNDGLYFRRYGEEKLVEFQVLGERGSATNFVRKLLQDNTRIERWESLGWKHGMPRMVTIPRDFLVVAVVRDARDWALSMHKRPWHADPCMQGLPFSTFLRAEWRGIVDRTKDFEEIDPTFLTRVTGLPLELDRHPITGKPFPNLFALRRTKLYGLLSFLNRDCNMALVRAETVQADPSGFIAWVLDQTGAAPSRESLALSADRMGNRFRHSVSQVPVTPSRFSDEDLAFLKAELDLPLEAALGYTYD